MGCINSTCRLIPNSNNVVEPCTLKEQFIEHAEKNMNTENKKGLEILKSQGSEAVVTYMFNPTGGDPQLSYGEMRARFG